MDSQYIKDGWFFEKDTFKNGYTQGLKVKNILYHEKSEYQDVLNNGNVLVLDGAVQCVENDEFVYQEMMAFLPVNSHSHPSNVLVIGGGDGGVLRELNKHPIVKNITLCEIDQNVVEVSKRYLPKMAAGFSSEKCQLVIQDAYEYLKCCKAKFDVIICDLSDPDGPSEKLYTEESINLMFNSLEPDGIMCLQSESFWTTLPLISQLMKSCKNIFPSTAYASFNTPTYPFGQIGSLLCSKSKYHDFTKPIFRMNPTQYNLSYYSPEIHTASFVLPPFVKQQLENV